MARFVEPEFAAELKATALTALAAVQLSEPLLRGARRGKNQLTSSIGATMPGPFDALSAGRDNVVPTARNRVMGVIADMLPHAAASQAHYGASEPGLADGRSDPAEPLGMLAAALGVGALLFAEWRNRPHR